jgi:hypothetical protein
MDFKFKIKFKKLNLNLESQLLSWALLHEMRETEFHLLHNCTLLVQSQRPHVPLPSAAHFSLLAQEKASFIQFNSYSVVGSILDT